jgi:hypothetical protein
MINRLWDRPMRDRFPILVDCAAASLAMGLALGAALALTRSHGLTDFTAIATSLAGLITITVTA